MILSIILSILDIITTIYAVSNGATELNPIPYNVLMPLKVVLCIGLIIVIVIMKKVKMKMVLLFTIYNIWYSIAVLNNIIVILNMGVY